MATGFVLAGLASLLLASQATNPSGPHEVGLMTSVALMNGCVSSVARGRGLSDAFAGSRLEKVERPAGLPVEETDLEVWRMPYEGAQIFVYAPSTDTSVCYVSVFGAKVEDVAPSIRTLLKSADSPFVEGTTEQVPGTGAAMVTYSSQNPALPLFLTLIANSEADESVPFVQMALKRIQ